MIKRRFLKQRDWFFDVLIFFVFEKQHSIKFTQKRNYKDTTFYYINFFEKYNWVFLKKHSCLGLLNFVDWIAYQNIVNILRVTKMLNRVGVVQIAQMFSLGKNKYINFIQTEKSKNLGISKLWHGATFYERELSEMFGKKFENSKDNRKLLLEYTNYKTPMLKHFDQVGFLSISYDKFKDSLIFKKSTSVSI